MFIINLLFRIVIFTKNHAYHISEVSDIVKEKDNNASVSSGIRM